MPKYDLESNGNGQPMPEEKKQLARQIGKVCRAGREDMTLTQVDVARMLGVSTEFYGRIERGESLPSVPTLVLLAAVLALRVDEMLGLSEEAQNVVFPPAKNRGKEPRAVRNVMRRIRQARPKTWRFVLAMLEQLHPDDTD